MGLWEMIKGEQPGIIESLLNYKDVGHYGEYLTTYALNHDNLPGYLKTICNLYIPYKGNTSEIDVLMIHEKGIFVFESKNYSGWIFGGAESQKWTQCLPNKQRHSFYNPIFQNKTHIRALSQYMGLPESAFSSYIIFSERCELKRVPDDTESYIILRRHHLLRKLRQVLKERDIRYTQQEVDTIYAQLQNTANAAEEVKQQHIETIQEKKDGVLCPYCGSKLILREGKYGKFYGCSSYPKCKYAKKI